LGEELKHLTGWGWEDGYANFNKAQEYIVAALEAKPDIICLSENFLYRGDDKELEPEDESSKYIRAFQELAKNNRVNLLLGTIILHTESEKNTNTSLVIDRQGKVVHRYDKIYMYDVERADLTFRESDTVQSGAAVGLFELEGIKVGVGICVDLRYPEYFRELVKGGAELIFLPSNFRRLTGELAWKVLTKARAIENQIYFCGCGQTGGIGAKERCGCSCIISYDGKVISEIGLEEGIISADLDLTAQRRFRKEFPVLRQMK